MPLDEKVSNLSGPVGTSVADPGFLNRIPDQFFYTGSQIPGPGQKDPRYQILIKEFLSILNPKKWF